jgi:hypothetical protein
LFSRNILTHILHHIDGVVYSWGDATEGATGHDGMDDQDGHILTPLPVEIKPAIKFLQVSCGLYHTIAMTGARVLFLLATFTPFRPSFPLDLPFVSTRILPVTTDC